MNGYSIRVGVLGAGGYSGRELVAILARHARVGIVFATSESDAGRPLRSICASAPELSLVRAAEAPLGECDAIFCCLPHGESMRWAGRARNAGAKVIDLSSDLRVVRADLPEWTRTAVYGLPELHRERIRGAELIANPGCYPTAAILALAPLVRRELIAGPVVINAASGVTGAGRSPKRELLFAEVAEDYRAYGTGNTHRHLAEMKDQVSGLAPGEAPELVFVPHLLPVHRGILETIHVPLRSELNGEAIDLWAEDYAGEPFIDLFREGTPSLRDVVRTNRVAIAVARVDGVRSPMLQVIAAEDNLVKGAAGQAVQNLNLMFGVPETESLA
jgi:N-acetyl-gamma-glutamyl-phosphate reductase